MHDTKLQADYRENPVGDGEGPAMGRSVSTFGKARNRPAKNTSGLSKSSPSAASASPVGDAIFGSASATLPPLTAGYMSIS